MSPVERLWTRVRPWVVLGRVSNLPTVWSNCLAAWLLADGGEGGRLALVLIAGTLVYLGGMLLNDAWDASWDRRYRPERPVPAGQVPRWEVGAWGCGLLLLGGVTWTGLGGVSAILGWMLVVSVVVYTAIHKLAAWGPWVMGLCRYLLFLGAASAGAERVTGEVVWVALVLGGYVVGLSYVARGEATGGVGVPLAWLGLAGPLVLAGFLNPIYAWTTPRVLGPAALYAVWTFRSATLLRRGKPGSAVSGLLAGMIWVDVLAVLPQGWPWAAVFVGLFLLAKVGQRWVPAT